MADRLNRKALFIDFDSTFVKIETIDELARLTLQNNPDKDSKIDLIAGITNCDINDKRLWPEIACKGNLHGLEKRESYNNDYFDRRLNNVFGNPSHSEKLLIGNLSINFDQTYPDKNNHGIRL